MRRPLLVSIVLLAGLSRAVPAPLGGRPGVGLISKGAYCAGCAIVVEQAIASLTAASSRWLPVQEFRALAVVQQIRGVLPPDEIYLVVVSDQTVQLLVRMPVAPRSQMDTWRQLKPLVDGIDAEASHPE